jgi:hypothetical protein
MKHPSSPRSRALILMLGLAAIVALSASMVYADGSSFGADYSAPGLDSMPSDTTAMPAAPADTSITPAAPSDNATMAAPTTSRVLGVAMQPNPGRIMLSLRTNGIKSFVPEALTAGYTTITVVNSTSVSRGLIIKSRDVIGNPVVRYIPLLRPYRTYKFDLFLGTGSFTAMDYSRGMRPLRHWRTYYQTSFMIAP